MKRDFITASHTYATVNWERAPCSWLFIHKPLDCAAPSGVSATRAVLRVGYTRATDNHTYSRKMAQPRVREVERARQIPLSCCQNKYRELYSLSHERIWDKNEYSSCGDKAHIEKLRRQVSGHRKEEKISACSVRTNRTRKIDNAFGFGL